MPYTPSTLKIIQRIKKSEFNEHGVVTPSRLSLARPALVLFGGDFTEDDRNANHYASAMENVLTHAGVSGIDIYSVYYKFGDRNSFLDRVNLFRQAGQRLDLRFASQEEKLSRMNENEPIPQMIIRAYQMVIHPRLVTESDAPRSMATIIKYMRRIRFWAHSHGGAIIRHLGDYMYDQMRNMGFTNAQISEIQQNLLVIQHAAQVPLHHMRFNTITFASTSDDKMDLYNNFSNWIESHPDMGGPVYFPPEQGNVFAAHHLSHNPDDEHDMCYLRFNSPEYKNLTDNGRIICDAERNAIIASAKNAIDGGPIPTPEQLVSGPTIDFAQMRDRGERMYNAMLNDLRGRSQIPVPGHQK